MPIRLKSHNRRLEAALRGAVMIAVALLAGCNDRKAPSAPTTACQFKRILIIDRTTQLDDRSKNLLLDGIHHIVWDDKELSGEIVAYEVRSSGTGYVPLLAPRSIPAMPPHQTAATCKGGAYETDQYAACMRKKRQSEQQETAARAARATALDETVAALRALVMVDAPDSDQTEIAPALVHILQKECMGATCLLFVMSDLIETPSRRLAHQNKQTEASAIEPLARARVASLPKLRSDITLTRIVVWGLGRDEIEGRELAAVGRSNLERYWQQMLVLIGFKPENILIGYEYPDLSRSEWAKESALCPKAPTNQ